MDKVDPVYPLKIAEDLGIPLDPEKRFAFSDDTYFEYVKRYREWAGKRDEELSEHLKNNPDPFRCFIPHNPNTYRLCSQVVWYYDQVIVSDPLGFLLRDIREDRRQSEIENRKKSLRSILGLFSYFRIPIETKYLLIAGRTVFPKTPEVPPEVTEPLLKNPEIKRLLRAATRYGLKKGTTDQGNLCYVWDAQLYWGFAVGWIFKKETPGKDISAVYTVGETLPEVTLDEILSLTKKNDTALKLDVTYKFELEFILKYALKGGSLLAAVLFDRELDAKTLALTGNPGLDINKQAEAIMPLNLTLPYLEQVPPEILAELRIAMPEAFLDFRNSMRSIVNSALKAGPDDAYAFAKEEADKKILPEIRKLDAEVTAAIKKAKIITYGIPISLAFGALLGNIIGAPPFVGVGAAAVGTGAVAFKAWADYLAKLESIKGNTFYFLWKARRHPAEDYF